MRLEFKIAWTLLVFIIICIVINNLSNHNVIMEGKNSLPEGKTCFVNGVICQNITCGLPGGCRASNCTGNVEYMGALHIKCVIIPKR